MRKAMKKLKISLCAAGAALGIVCGTFAPSLSAAAAPAYDSKYTQQYSMEYLLIPSLLKNTDARGVYRQLKQAMRYQTITQGDIWDMYLQGCNIPALAVQCLYNDQMVSGYLYKTIAGLPYESSDFKDVFDPVFYWCAYPEVQEKIPVYDEQQVLNNWLTEGMAAGRMGSAEFNLDYYKANYPDLAAVFGDNNINYYLHYIIYGKDKGMIADKLLSSTK